MFVGVQRKPYSACAQRAHEEEKGGERRFQLEWPANAPRRRRAGGDRGRACTTGKGLRRTPGHVVDQSMARAVLSQEALNAEKERILGAQGRNGGPLRVLVHSFQYTLVGSLGSSR